MSAKTNWLPGILVVLATFIAATSHAQPGNDAGVVLIGKIITMNNAGEVLANARLWLKGGKIEAIAKMGEALPDASKDAVEIATNGAIYPGMIDLHNHPEYAHYPVLPISKKYRDRYEWRWYDDDYNKRITFPQIVLERAQYYDLGIEIGRYGEYKALVGGTTTLQGSRPTQPYASAECLVRNIETTQVGARLAFSHVDIGRDAEEWKKLQDEYSKGVLVVHLAEGPSPRMAEEFRYLKQSGLIGANLIAIHGVGLTEPQLQEMAVAKAKLVWSPLSNFLLYGKTANIDAARRAGLAISIAPDWQPSGSKSVLGELKAADLVNKNALKVPFTDKQLVEMVTRNPADAMQWGDKLGQIAVGYLADVIVVDDRHADSYRNLIEATEENIRLVLVRGEPLYGDAILLQNARKTADDLETATNFSGTREKAIAPNCANTALPKMSLKETMARLQNGLNFDPTYTAQKVSLEQFSRDLLICGLAKPGDPPTAADAKRLLACRYSLPFEPTKLSPLTTNDDPDFMKAIMANPNLPTYMQKLPEYYRHR